MEILEHKTQDVEVENFLNIFIFQTSRQILTDQHYINILNIHQILTYKR
jgi:hypothetical protein